MYLNDCNFNWDDLTRNWIFYDIRLTWSFFSPKSFTPESQQKFLICLIGLFWSKTVRQGAIDVRHGITSHQMLTSAPSSIGKLTSAQCKMITCAEVNEFFRNLCRSSCAEVRLPGQARLIQELGYDQLYILESSESFRKFYIYIL